MGDRVKDGLALLLLVAATAALRATSFVPAVVDTDEGLYMVQAAAWLEGGWPLVAVFTVFVGLSLGELASAFPTAGALYHWSSILGGPGAGWATAWLNVLGQFAITAAIDFGLAEFLAPQGGLLPMLVLTTASTVGEGITRAMELQRMLAAQGLQ
jgi:amino acid transporter